MRHRKPKPLEVELLAADYMRRLSVDEHQDFCGALTGPARTRKAKEAARVESLLDQIFGSKEGGK